MSDMIKIAAAAVAAALCAVVVRRQSPEIALVLGIGACALIVLYCSGALTAVMELVDKLAEAGNLSAQAVEPVIKTAGIAIVTRLAADFCKDAQEGGLASAVELAGTALALAAALPLMSAVLDVLTRLL
ncbi:MAG: stage III sporulation protein AD [Clostridiales bacterium]|nr:stage III sporulation protein AD [Clostridiales bacterium]